MLSLLAGVTLVRAEEEVALPHFGQITEDNAENYYNNLKEGENLLWFSFHPEQVKDHAELHGPVLTEAAKATPNMKFVWYDTSEMEEHATEGLGCKEFPCVSLVVPGVEEEDNPDAVFTQTLPTVDAKSVSSFLQDVKDEKVEPYFGDMGDFDDEEYYDEEGEEGDFEGEEGVEAPEM